MKASMKNELLRNNLKVSLPAYSRQPQQENTSEELRKPTVCPNS
jgi:hypothetical protein